MKQELERVFDELWPICRSLTGKGLRDSFHILQKTIPFQLTEVPSGTEVFDWVVPREWNINNAYIIAPDGRKIADFAVNNLHIVNYSTPIHQKMSFEELKSHLHFLTGQPNAIPYVTSYYKEYWGFCISYDTFNSLPEEGEYEVFIDSSLEDGSLTYGDVVIPGQTNKEVLFSSYLCHPSMANNELSGPLVMAFLYQKIKKEIPNPRYTYRFVLAPETIGIISYLDKYGDHLLNYLAAGYVITCIGDAGDYTYKRSRRGNSLADQVAEHVLKYKDNVNPIEDFSVGGSDERQYCSPGFNLPVGSLMRTKYQNYKEYHTSLDNKSMISFEAMEESVNTYFEMVKVLELNKNYKNKIDKCEPQLGKRGLYPSSINPDFQRERVHDLLYFLNMADGEHDLITIADGRNKCALEFEEIIEQCDEKSLLN